MSLTEALVDDLANIGYDETTYEAPKASTPPPRGTYDLRITGHKEQTAFGSSALKTPYELSVDFVIANGPFEGRTARFQKVSSRAYKSRQSSMLTDLIAAVAKATNHEGPVKGREAILQLLDVARDTNAVIRGRTDWKAEDKTFLKNKREANEEMTSEDWDAYRVEGQSKFDADGTVVGPSGETLVANLTVLGFVAPKN